MEDAALIVSFGDLVVSGVAAAAAVVQARSAESSRLAAEEARNESRTARDEAVRLTREANAAFVRQAVAQEEANELVRAAAPKKEPKFNLVEVSKSRWMATNVGTAVARRVQITKVSGWVHAEEDAPRDLDIGDSLYFNAMSLGGETPRIELNFSNALDGELEDFRNEITLP